MAATDLLNRYLYAVSRYLPPERHDDVLAALGAQLHAEMEQKAAALGHPLSEDEQAVLLRHHGPPLVAAARYQPQRALIGPEIFPFYIFTLKRLLPLVVGANLLAQAAVLVFGAATGSISTRVHPVSVLHDLLYAVLASLVVITGGFAIAEAYASNWRQRLMRHAWDPRRLPRAQTIQHDGPRHPWADAIASAVFLLWLLALPHVPVLIVGPTVAWRLLSIDLPSIWHTFYWLIVAFTVVQLALRLALLVSSLRRHFRAIDCFLHLAGIAILIFMLRPHDYVGQATFGGNALSAETVATLNFNIHNGLLILLVLAIGLLLWDTAQWLRPKHDAAPAPPGSISSA